jgi:hypothetical protein
MVKDKRLWNRYVSQLEDAIAQARAKPNYDPDKFVWKGWECWIAGYRAGQRSSRAKRASQRR